MRVFLSLGLLFIVGALVYTLLEQPEPPRIEAQELHGIDFSQINRALEKENIETPSPKVLQTAEVKVDPDEEDHHRDVNDSGLSELNPEEEEYLRTRREYYERVEKGSL